MKKEGTLSSRSWFVESRREGLTTEEYYALVDMFEVGDSLKKYQEKHGLNCTICSKDLSENQCLLHIDISNNTDVETCMFEGGFFMQGTAGYGSRHDNNSFLILICDDCVEKHAKLSLQG